MPIRAWLINWVSNLNRDHQVWAIHQAILDDGVISWLEVTTWQVSAGTAIVRCVRTSTTPNEVVFVSVDITTAEVIDTTGTKKVWLKVLDANVNDPSLNTNANGTGIAVIQTGVSYPAGNYVPLAGITAGVITDERNYARVGSSGLTLQTLKRVRATSTTPLTLASINNGSTVDSITVNTNDLVLLTGQSDQKENGIWRVRASGWPVRWQWWQRGDELWRSAVIANEGGTNARKLFVNTNTSAITIGTTNITFLEISVTAPTSVTSTYTAGDTISAWQVLSIDDFVENTQVVPRLESVDWGWVVARTRVAQEFVVWANSITIDKISLRQRRITTPTATLITIRIETNSGGLPSGTLADANATVSFDPSTLTTSLANYTYTFPGAFTLTNGTTYHIVMSHNGTVAAANDFRLAWETGGWTFTQLQRTANYGGSWNGSAWSNTDLNFWAQLISSTSWRLVRSKADNPQRFTPIWIASGASTNGNPVSVVITWSDINQSGLAANTWYYVSNTLGTVSTTPGTNIAFVGTAINTTNIKYEPQDGLAKAIATGWFVSISNSTTITSMIPTTLSWRNKAYRDFRFPANFFYPWKRLRFSGTGAISLVSTNIFNLALIANGWAISLNTAFQDSSAAWSSLWFSFEYEVVCRSTGASGSFHCTSELLVWGGNTDTPGHRTYRSNQTTTQDTTLELQLWLNAQFGTASASNTFTITDFYFEELS